MSIEMTQLRQIFFEEAERHVSALDTSWRQLLSEPGDQAALRQMRRVIHSLKGTANALSITPVAELAHQIEDALAAWPAHSLAEHAHLMPPLSDLMKRLRDQLGIRDQARRFHVRVDHQTTPPSRFGQRVSLQATFERLRLATASLSRQTDKQVSIQFHGGELEVDSSTVATLIDPLFQLVRNALEHGIELPHERLLLGKAAEGRISLRAFQHDRGIRLEVEDDGRGLNREAIRQAAASQGLVRATDELPPSATDQLIFTPGLSTARQVTELSGRGVGLDIVQATSKLLGGHVRVDSVPSQGTKITLWIPSPAGYRPTSENRRSDRASLPKPPSSSGLGREFPVENQKIFT